MTETLLSRLSERGYQGQVVPIHHIRELEEEFEHYHRQGALNDELYREYLESFEFAPPASLPNARSLVVVAVPQPQVRVTFTWNGESRSLVVPPTYLRSRRVDKRVEDLVAETLAPAGYRAVPAVLPKKLLAVRSGLARYGMNNISYVPGMGSFHRIVVLYAELPCRQDNWTDVRAMEVCEKCRACLRACPTGAIVPERFLIRAERCIAFWNEKPPDVPFPSWLDPAWHDCLIGCMHCQKSCPPNKDVLHWFEDGPTFTEQESVLFLKGVALEQLAPATVKKLEQFDMLNYLDTMARNLSVVLKRN